MVTCSLQANPPDLTSESTYNAASDPTSCGTVFLLLTLLLTVLFLLTLRLTLFLSVLLLLTLNSTALLTVLLLSSE